jgi:hypothetical protein
LIDIENLSLLNDLLEGALVNVQVNENI